MKHLLRACLACILLAINPLIADSPKSIVFIKDTTGDLRVDGQRYSQHEIFDPVGKRIAIENGQATLVFSNGLAMVMRPDTVMTVKAFNQEPPDEYLLGDNDVEVSPSELVLQMDSGGFIAANTKPRATSTLTIEMPQGTLTGNATALAVSLDSVPAEVAVLDGLMRLRRDKYDPLTLQSGQWVDLGKASYQSRGQLLSAMEPARAAAYSERLGQVDRLRRMVVFMPAEQSWQATVMVPEDFVKHAAVNDHHLRQY